MNRKTNLFYNANSQDSNFLTFSNYTESLTGNYLSTDTKLFPSTFLCLKIPRLYASDSESYNIIKQEFIQNWLVRRYENKLAFLRDYCNNEDDLVESRLLPLNYLLEYILEYDPSTEITYVDNITEQDYNGTFTDTICMINSTKFKHAKIVKLTDEEIAKNEELYADYKFSDENKNRYNYSSRFLYGWYTTKNEKYRNSFDMNCDGHVDEIDLELFKNSKDTVKDCIKIEHSDWDDTQLEAEYAIRLTQIEEMVEWNSNIHNYDGDPNVPNSPIQWTGPIYANITTSKEIINDTEHICSPDTCIVADEKTGKCCCQAINEEVKINYNVEKTPKHLAPIFDYPTEYMDEPVKPEEKDYIDSEGVLNNTEYEQALQQYYADMAKYAEYLKKDKYYKVTSTLSKIDLTEEREIVDSKSIQSIEFNIIIPLYDVIDIESSTNSFIIDEIDEIPLQNTVSDPCLYIRDVPMGMWFSGYEPVILKRDLNSKYCPSWSLVIGSQFKPFPYSKNMPDEISSSAKADAFMTFAQILTRQNEMIDKMSNLFKMIADLNGRMADLESNVASLATTYNIDNLNQKIVNNYIQLGNEINELKNILAERDLKWVNREG